MTYVVIAAFVGILGSLALALYFMLRPGAPGKARTHFMARALAWRVGISIFIFLSILLGWKLGYLHPTGIPSGK